MCRRQNQKSVLQKIAQVKARKLRMNEVPQKEEIQNCVKESKTFLEGMQTFVELV